MSALTERPSTFDWSETPVRLRDFAADRGATLAPDERAFVSDDGAWRFEPPLVQSIAPGITTPESYEIDIGTSLGLQLVVLVRAGAFAFGLWRDDELLTHKAQKRYVVRGNGRAQPSHLARKGKSRYGSRLRLRNAAAQHEDLVSRLRTIDEEHGRPRGLWLACPTRLASDLHAASSGMPWPRGAWLRIPYHVHQPDFGEVLRVRALLVRGRILPVTS
ncbi:MAG: hypothetical protein H6832_07465 [Planctomycetes bacterium]|nr:hypothetical protein [Planctomycetota bacterium]